MQPEFEDEEAINPFDFWQGANFKLKLKKVAGYWNYDSSEFDRVAPLLDDDDALEVHWKKQYSLTAITADQFKTYEQLETRLKMVLGQKSSRPRYDEELEDESFEGRGSFSPNFNQAAQTGELPSDIKEQLNNLNYKDADEDEDEEASLFPETRRGLRLET